MNLLEQCRPNVKSPHITPSIAMSSSERRVVEYYSVGLGPHARPLPPRPGSVTDRSTLSPCALQPVPRPPSLPQYLQPFAQKQRGGDRPTGGRNEQSLRARGAREGSRSQSGTHHAGRRPRHACAEGHGAGRPPVQRPCESGPRAVQSRRGAHPCGVPGRPRATRDRAPRVPETDENLQGGRVQLDDARAGLRAGEFEEASLEINLGPGKAPDLITSMACMRSSEMAAHGRVGSVAQFANHMLRVRKKADVAKSLSMFGGHEANSTGAANGEWDESDVQPNPPGKRGISDGQYCREWV